MIAESHVEEAALAWRAALGYSVRYGPAIAAGEPAAERTDPNCRDTILQRRLRQTVTPPTPTCPPTHSTMRTEN